MLRSFLTSLETTRITRMYGIKQLLCKVRALAKPAYYFLTWVKMNKNNKKMGKHGTTWFQIGLYESECDKLDPNCYKWVQMGRSWKFFPAPTKAQHRNPAFFKAQVELSSDIPYYF